MSTIGRLFLSPDRRELTSWVDHEVVSVPGESLRALRPEELHPIEPQANCVPKTPIQRVVLGSQLLVEAARAKNGYGNGPTFGGLTPPNNPQVEVQNARGVGQGGDHLALHRNAVGVNLGVESLAEGDDVLRRARGSRGRAVVRGIEPEAQVIKEMKSR